MVTVGMDTACERSQVLRFQRGPITPRIGWLSITNEVAGLSPNTLDTIAGGAADEVFEFERSDGC